MRYSLCILCDCVPSPPADLRRALVARLKPYTRKATPTGKELGIGTYGSVIELTSARETVAGKVFRMSSTVRFAEVVSVVCRELIMMTQLHHPNIVQCKGVSLPTATDHPFPILLMERLTTSLHDYVLDPEIFQWREKCPFYMTLLVDWTTFTARHLPSSIET